jgi:hypothetical protein
MIALSFAIAAVIFGKVSRAYFLLPPAELCFPDSGLKELSGCKAMATISDLCKSKTTLEEKLECFCTQEMLSSYFE